MKNFSRRDVLIAGAGGALASGSALNLAMAQSGYPNRPVTLVVPWGAGGGTDATARQMGALLENELKQPVNVVNRTGGSGVVGHSAIANAAPDGYTIGMVTVEVTMLQQQGLTTLTPADFTPLARLVSPAPGVIVGTDSPYKNIKELADAIKAAPPGKFKASGTGQGGSWHIGLVGWLIAMRLKPDHVTWVPSQGAAPALQEVAAGGIDFATCSVPEARALIEAGKVRALANMAIQRNPAFPDVPTVAEATGVKHTFGAWIGMAAPKGLPNDVRDKLIAAIKRANESKEFTDFVAARGLAPGWMGGVEFGSYMAEQVQSNTPLLRALGMVKG
jgi:tripartite-type tricarboxylate transporter receptor subunit TctC